MSENWKFAIERLAYHINNVVVTLGITDLFNERGSNTSGWLYREGGQMASSRWGPHRPLGLNRDCLQVTRNYYQGTYILADTSCTNVQVTSFICQWKEPVVFGTALIVFEDVEGLELKQSDLDWGNFLFFNNNSIVDCLIR